ncbi:citrate transporter : Na+/H+ antiporter NhaD-like permease OS=Singulisphaera acidiphila (strain ATCC BAA-1392 / DSM 18658 / VKM B-2454 / MOB10) GN=Sinac_2218 PE=4 SV=1: CitMHS [Gemmataceae bacterium]|nr:citrate transporter : Na+/H+ antiporter NhaD-like permease OS=Singulisphaera acidiphila (strain ATCC BAA-1392 / DSM 18658 / VKM B-2454 / MOB10) GN=Sinac_2218 PE=4 SV=1: CitMHS [Gemmataceae bacterium]VTT97717.1 citrate transporter : Na+/H+ antiporter NhaD-like permease OS=Singulisphaera acidiphila (strain ATCC BAA-1392 / DSM 18658 / VKM B-2454 / MOB10) GN=Sinac_2218 PE=4 SV=1: CitMHS [Gemmataceae bacterium]
MPATAAFWLTLFWFALTYLGLALGRLPWLRTDRVGVALVGAAGALACGLIAFDDAVRAIDFRTLALLLGMMIVVAFLRRAGFFARVAGIALGRVKSPKGLLAVVMLLSGVLSAVLVNDVVCVAMTPLVLHLTRRLGLDPRPHLVGLAVASNLGSAAALTGNPQNMIIGGLSGISYLRFAAKLAPPAALGLVVGYVVTLIAYRSVLNAPPRADARDLTDRAPSGRRHTALLAKSLTMTLVAVGLFFGGFSMAVVALAAAAVLLLDRVNPGKIYSHVDWGLLLMFAGLFVVVRTFEVHVLSTAGVEEWAARADPVWALSGLSAVLSNIVSNVPAVLLFKPVVGAMPEAAQETAWLALALSSTFAGNLTVLGSVANLIVVEQARKEGVAIGFWDYCRVGTPVTLITLVLGAAWLAFVPY